MFPSFIASPPSRKRNAWSYIDARDLGQICNLAIQKSGLGFQVFNATNNTVTLPDEVLGEGGVKGWLERNYGGKGVEVGEMGEREAPLCNRKIREVLGFKDVHDWREYVKL